MSELYLDSLEIKGYRGFDNLVVERFGRVNLIVGKNNSGKSSLLEAIWLYARKGAAAVVSEILRSREESARFGNRIYQDGEAQISERIWDIKYIFSGRKDVREDSFPIFISSHKKPQNKVSIQVQWFISNEKGISPISEQPLLDSNWQDDLAEPYIVIKSNSKEDDTRFPLQRLMSNRMIFSRANKSVQYIKADGAISARLQILWDNVALTDFEGFAVKALKIIAPEIQRLSFLGDEDRGTERIPFARLENSNEPIPLRSMGEGMNKLLGISLSLIYCNNGVLLLDEVENGLHYSVLLDVWRLIFETAKELNVQVFATTHSADCIRAFQRAAEEDKENEGILIRLVRKGDKIKAVLFDEEELETVVENNIEVR